MPSVKNHRRPRSALVMAFAVPQLALGCPKTRGLMVVVAPLRVFRDCSTCVFATVGVRFLRYCLTCVLATVSVRFLVCVFATTVEFSVRWSRLLLELGWLSGWVGCRIVRGCTITKLKFAANLGN